MPASSDRELRLFTYRLARLAVVIVLLLIAGTIGYLVSTDRGVWESFVLSLDTIATVGSIPHPTTTGAEIVTVGLIITGVGTLFYALVTVTEFFVSGHLGQLLAQRRSQKLIDALSYHYIICGWGRVGRQVARDLRAAGARYVVIDENPEARNADVGIGARLICGRPSDDDILGQAGIERARGLIACMDSDAENIFTTLTARELNPDVAIVARAASEDSESKLRRAGADRVISPYKASGAEMARLALHPQVSGAVDVAPEYRMEEIEVVAGCDGAGRTVGDIRGGSVIAGVRKPDGGFHPQPPAETVLHVGDVVVVMGTPRTLERLERLFDPAHAGASA
jgi:voltage-gated potassium channel